MKQKGWNLSVYYKMRRLTYLTKLTPRGDDFIFYLDRKVMC